METLQKEIERRAKKRLQEDIEKFLQELKQNMLWDLISCSLKIKIEEDFDTLRTHFWSLQAKGGKYILEKCLSKYIEDETKAFLLNIKQFQEFQQEPKFQEEPKQILKKSFFSKVKDYFRGGCQSKNDLNEPMDDLPF